LRLDADGDRLHLDDEGGNPLDPELTLALVVLAREPRKVVKGADTSRIVDALLEARGGSVEVVPPGEVHLLDGMARTQADVAGEGNGGVVIRDAGLARDALAAAAAILWLLARRGQSVSAIAAELPRYARRRSTVPCPETSRGRAALKSLGERIGIGLADPESGIRVERGEGAWGLVRMSATEPVMRLTSEAPTDAMAEALHAELRAALLARLEKR
jgi:phosphomannomutase